MPFLTYQPLKMLLRVFLADQAVDVMIARASKENLYSDYESKLTCFLVFVAVFSNETEIMYFAFR